MSQRLLALNIGLFIALVGSFCFASPEGAPLAYADALLYSQPANIDESSLILRSALNVSEIASQHDATVSASISNVRLHLKRNSGDPATGNWSVLVYEDGSVPESGTLVATSISTTSASVATTSTMWVQFNFNTSWLERAGHTYYYVLQTDALDNPKAIISTTGVNDFEWEKCTGCGGADWQKKTATYAVQIYDSSTVSGTTTPEGITDIVSPLENSTTVDNTPLFSFDYYVIHSYDRSGIYLQDLTSGQSLDTSTASDTIAASGAHTYQEYFGLTSGHLYSWRPVLYSSSNVLPTIYGDAQSFFAVTTASYQSLPATTSNPFSSSSIYNNGWVSTTTASSTNFTISTALGSTTALARCFAFMPSNVRNAMSIKFPFSYLCDLNLLMSELLNGDGNASGNLQLGMVRGTTTLIDKTAISSIGAVQQMKTVIGYALYLSTAFGIVWAIMRIF